MKHDEDCDTTVTTSTPESTTILQAGVAKSGNYWLWRILREIHLLNDVEIRSFNRTLPVFEEARTWPHMTHEDQLETDVVDVDDSGVHVRIASRYRSEVDASDLVAGSSHLWTHSEFHAYFTPILSRAGHTFYLIRDPRDVVISMANFAFTPYYLEYYGRQEKNVSSYLENRFEWQLRGWAKHVHGWLQACLEFPDKVSVVFYENLRRDFEFEVATIAASQNLRVSTAQARSIRDALSVENMAKRNPGHVRREHSGWESVLSDGQREICDKVAGPLLSVLGYPSSDRDSAEIEDGRSERRSSVGVTQEVLADAERAFSYDKGDYLRAAWFLAKSGRPLSSKLRLVRSKLQGR